MVYRKISAAFLLLTLLVAEGYYGSSVVFGAQKHSDISSDDVSGARIISAGGSITEVMYALGLGDRIVAVDASSFYPLQATKLPQIGYFRSLAAEGLMSLNPDILVAANGAGPDVVLRQVEALGVTVKSYEQSIYTLESWEALIRSIGEDFNRASAAQKLVESVNKGIVRHLDRRNFQDNKLNAIALLSIGQRGPVAAGSNTVPDLLLKLAGVNNVAKSLEGYKPFSNELLAKQKIDILLVPSHVVESLGGEEAICENQIIKLATSNECNLFVMDPLLLLGFGARLDQAVGDLVNYANGP